MLPPHWPYSATVHPLVDPDEEVGEAGVVVDFTVLLLGGVVTTLLVATPVEVGGHTGGPGGV